MIRTRFVEADVTGASDTQKLNIDAAALSDFCFVVAAVVGDLLHGNGAVRNMHVLGLDVDMIEEMLLHKPHVALQVFRLHRIVFVQIESHDVGKRQTFFFVHPDQFGIDAGRCGPCCQAQHCRFSFRLAAANERRDFRRHETRRFARICQNRTSQLFKLTQVLPLVHKNRDLFV